MSKSIKVKKSAKSSAETQQFRQDDIQVPAEFNDAVVWAAWLYHVDQMTQSDVAKIIGVSRATIINYLQEAKERGLVSIVINDEALSQTSLARALSEKYGLRACQVIPTLDETSNLNTRLGIAGAKFLSNNIAPNDIIGVAWGKTVLALSKAMPRDIRQDVSIVQVVGSSSGSAEFSPELCTSVLANRINARCVNLHAPTMLSSIELRDQLLQEEVIKEQFNLIHNCSKIIFGVGDMSKSSTIKASNFITHDEINAYKDEGATAVIIGRFIDGEGNVVSRETDQRMMGITLEKLKQVPMRLCIAGGASKIEAIHSTLKGKFATHLITDVETARLLLK